MHSFGNDCHLHRKKIRPVAGPHVSPVLAKRGSEPSRISLPTSQSSPPTSQNSFLHPSLLFHCIARRNQLHKKRRDAPVLTHGRSLTTNHLLTKGDPWLTQILPAHQKTLAAHPNPSSTIFSTVSTQLSPASIAIWRHWKGSAFSIR